MRTVRAVVSAALAVRNGEQAEIAFNALRLALSPHTAGNDFTPSLEWEGALGIVRRAETECMKPFQLWLVFDAFACESLDEAVEKQRELDRLYASPLRSN